MPVLVLLDLLVDSLGLGRSEPVGHLDWIAIRQPLIVLVAQALFEVFACAAELRVVSSKLDFVELLNLVEKDPVAVLQRAEIRVLALKYGATQAAKLLDDSDDALVGV